MVERAMLIAMSTVIAIAVAGIIGDEIFTALNTFACEMRNATVCVVK